jgi:hypothetical protein
MSHQVETEQRQTYVLIWGESDNASPAKCMALVRMLHPAYGCRILGPFLDVDCSNSGQDYGSFSTRNLNRTRLISAERDGYFGKIADTPFHVPAGS